MAEVDMSSPENPQTPKIAIGVPVFNGDRWLADTVQSILDQSFADFSIVICDNASTDRSPDIAREMATRDDRIHFHRNSENIGVFRNMDRTFDLSNAPYFKWCSVGDRMHPSFLNQALQVLEADPGVSLVFTTTELFGSLAEIEKITNVDLELDAPDPIDRYRAYLTKVGLNSPFHGLIRSKALSKTSLNQGFQGSDLCLVSALLLQGKAIRLPERMLYRRIERDTATVAKSTEELDEFFGSDAQNVKRFATWKIEKQFISDVLKSNLGLKSKASILKFLLRRVIRLRHNLAREAWSWISR